MVAISLVADLWCVFWVVCRCFALTRLSVCSICHSCPYSSEAGARDLKVVECWTTLCVCLLHSPFTQLISPIPDTSQYSTALAFPPSFHSSSSRYRPARLRTETSRGAVVCARPLLVNIQCSISVADATSFASGLSSGEARFYFT
jgi:hypothetical protein